MLILAGVSINAVVGDNGIITKAQQTGYLQSIAVLEEFLQMEATNYTLEENPYETLQGLLKAKHPGWFYKNTQGYILDSEGHVLYLINKSGLPEEIQDQLRGGDASKVSQYYRQQDVYGVTSDLQVYYCNDGTSSILGLTLEDLDKDNPLEIAYDEDSLLAKVINGVGEDGRATEAISTQGLKSIKTLTIDTTEKLALLPEFIKLPNLQKVHFNNITISTLEGMQHGTSITEVRFANCSVSDYSALCGLTNLKTLYLIRPAGKNTDVATLCSSDKGIATAEFSNLKYFGIVGNASYLQSTSKLFASDRYGITDVSGLANLSTTTKQAIQYMYLQNLQLTSIACLTDYINVLQMRLEYNALTTLNGIQNMSKLAYLIAPNCYSDATSSYTLGSVETDTQNSGTDALSYIYKNENGNNTSLYYLDIRNANKLKWTSYLSTCTGLRFLYMDNNASLKDVETIANTVAQCGTNYTIPATTALISNNSVKLELSNQTLTTAQFETLKNNTKLTHLSMCNIKITENGTQLTGTDLNNKINEILSTCTSLRYLQLASNLSLTTIEFVKNTPYLYELDLRNTGVTTGTIDASGNNTGLELLNDLITYNTDGSVKTALRQLSVNNDTIDFTKIQPTVSLLNGSTQLFEAGWVAGLYCGSWTALKTLENCKEITGLYFNWHNQCPIAYDANKTLDLSQCTKLKTFYACRFHNKIIFPSSLETYKEDYSYYVFPDFSLCTNLKSFAYVVDTSVSLEKWNNFFKTSLINCISLETLDLRRASLTDYSGLGTILPYLTNLKTIYMGTNYAYTTHPQLHICYDYSPLANAKSLENLYITHQETISDISFVEEMTNLKTINVSNTSVRQIPDLSKLTQLTTLVLNNNKIGDISGIANASNLTSINLNTNGVNNIKPLEKLKKLQTLDLRNNSLLDNSYDSTGKAYYTLTVLSDLNQKQGGTLKNLYLSGNNIDDFSMLNDSNLEWGERDWPME